MHGDLIHYSEQETGIKYWCKSARRFQGLIKEEEYMFDTLYIRIMENNSKFIGIKPYKSIKVG